ncbi:MAG TPA: zinc ribbon domain-containing protein [Vicinamibacteria bacterium]|nr:zinc ribbon domain-containing protein [Vicinamibacteria bacterium]
MTRFEQEWALVPAGARWTAALVALAFVSLMAAIFILPLLVEGEHKALLFVMPVFLAASLGAVGMALYVLLVGYVYGDARRRAMNHVLWTLLAVFIPNGIGIILYFILRDPVPVPCPKCGTPARKGHSFCASCGAPVRASCPQCRQPLEAGWRNCARCGASIAEAGAS